MSERSTWKGPVGSGRPTSKRTSIYIPVDQELMNRIRRVIPYGLRTITYQVLTKQLVEWLEEGDSLQKLHAIIKGRVNVKEVLK